MDNRVNIAVIIGVVFVLAFAVTLTQSENQVESQIVEDEIPDALIYEWLKKYDPSEQTISVSGSATASSNPDTLIIVLGVESEAKTANESLSQNSNSLNSVISSLSNSGISEDDIQTSNFSIYPLYDSIKDTDGNWQQILNGYRVSNILSIQTEKIDSAGDIIDAAVSSGANRIDNVSFQLSDDKLQHILIIYFQILSLKQKKHLYLTQERINSYLRGNHKTALALQQDSYAKLTLPVTIMSGDEDNVTLYFISHNNNFFTIILN